MARRTKAQLAEQAEARETLRGILSPGDKVQCVLRHVSRSGMSRDIDFYVVQVDDHGKPFMRYLTGYIATALDYPMAKSRGMKVGGCGMDMGFHVVYNVGRVLWPNGTPTPHGRRNGEADSDGGYALKSEWI